MINSDGFEFHSDGKQYRFVVSSDDEVVVQVLASDALGVEGWHEAPSPLSKYVTADRRFKLLEHHIREAQRKDFRTPNVYVCQHGDRRLVIVESDTRSSFYERNEVLRGGVWDSAPTTHHDLFVRAALDPATVRVLPRPSIPAWTDKHGEARWRDPKPAV